MQLLLTLCFRVKKLCLQQENFFKNFHYLIEVHHQNLHATIHACIVAHTKSQMNMFTAHFKKTCANWYQNKKKFQVVKTNNNTKNYS